MTRFVPLACHTDPVGGRAWLSVKRKEIITGLAKLDPIRDVIHERSAYATERRIEVYP